MGLDDQFTVLVVDDTKANVDVLVAGLRDHYQLSVALDGESALETAREVIPDLVLLDIMMPGMDGYEVCRQLKADPNLKDVPVMFLSALGEVTSKAKGFEAGGSDYLTKPFDLLEVRIRVQAMLEAKAYRDTMRNYQQRLEADVAAATASLSRAKHEISLGYLETTLRLALAAEFKDSDTGQHILRVARYAQVIGETLGLSSDACAGLLHATPLHDIGKVAIPESILTKPGKLTEEEMAVMRLHTTYGGKILEGSRSKLLVLGRIIALTHHERWDGRGYPNQLKEEQIPLSGRIVAICDVFDALTRRRVYKHAIPVEEAFTAVVGMAGVQFDPAIASAFQKSRAQIIEIHQEFVSKPNLSATDYLAQILVDGLDEGLLPESPMM